MAFFSKVGNILKQSVSKQITSQISASNPSIYQALRSMSSSKLFVGGLPWAVDDTSLQEAFSPYGEVIEARVIVDRENNRSRGFGFVTFTSSEEASSAIQAMDGQDMHGRRVRVNYATDRAPRQGGYGGGGYGGGGYGGGGYGGGGGGYGGGGYGGGGYVGGGGGGGGYGGGQNYRNSGGYSPSGQNTASGGDFAGGNYGVAGGVGGSESYFGGGASGSNVTAETGFGSSGLEDGSADQFGSNSSGGLGDDIGDFESKDPLEENFKDDEPNDFAKRA